MFFFFAFLHLISIHWNDDRDKAKFVHSASNDLFRFTFHILTTADEICQEQRAYDYVKVGVPLNKISYYVEINYYPDKELLVKSQSGCLRACSIESEFICRSILYRAAYRPGQPNCALYHLDHYTLPDGLDTFALQFNVPLPLFDTGDGSDAVYMEALCTSKFCGGLCRSHCLLIS
jgi:hypothetical protein